MALKAMSRGSLLQKSGYLGGWCRGWWVCLVRWSVGVFRCWFDQVDVHDPEFTAACSYDICLWVSGIWCQRLKRRLAGLKRRLAGLKYPGKRKLHASHAHRQTGGRRNSATPRALAPKPADKTQGQPVKTQKTCKTAVQGPQTPRHALNHKHRPCFH